MITVSCVEDGTPSGYGRNTSYGVDNHAMTECRQRQKRSRGYLSMSGSHRYMTVSAQRRGWLGPCLVHCIKVYRGARGVTKFVSHFRHGLLVVAFYALALVTQGRSSCSDRTRSLRSSVWLGFREKCGSSGGITDM